MEDPSTIWLEVTNIRSLEVGVEIQVKGDRAERGPEWWTVNKSAYSDSDAARIYRTVSENLDKKRIVLAGLGPKAATAKNVTLEIECKHFRIQYADSHSR